MPAFLDLTGRQFGHLEVIGQAHHILLPNGSKRVAWTCQCHCGKRTIVQCGHLASGHTNSCGCLRHEGHNKTHGMTQTRTYRIWHHIKERCFSTKCKEYRFYGGRGITMCPSWVNSFQSFLRDVGEAPTDREIDRIDNDGPYCPFNVRWATSIEQANNMRSNHKFTFNGETHGICEWSRILGVPRTTLRARLLRLGWTVEKAFGTERARVRSGA